MCEWLKTVSLLKSETTKDIISIKKLTKINNNCKKVKDRILLFNFLTSLKFLNEKKTIDKEKQNPKIKE